MGLLKLAMKSIRGCKRLAGGMRNQPLRCSKKMVLGNENNVPRHLGSHKILALANVHGIL